MWEGLVLVKQTMFPSKLGLCLLKVKEDKTAQEKMAKVDNINIIEKQDKPEKMEKMDQLEKNNESTKKTDNVEKTQKSEQIIKDEKKAQKEEKQDKAEKNEKVDKPEKTNKEKEEKKKNGENVDKTAKTEKNVTASKGPAKSPTANGSKEVTSPDSRAKVCLEIHFNILRDFNIHPIGIYDLNCNI